MTPAAWVAIGIALWSTVTGIGFWLLQRTLARQDRHEEALFDDSGVVAVLRAELAQLRAKFGEYVPRTEIEMTFGRLSNQVEQVRREGGDREVRILEAIDTLKGEANSDVRELRTEITGVHRAIADFNRIMARAEGREAERIRLEGQGRRSPRP